MITISKTYVLKWQLVFAPQYQWSSCGKCFNVQSGKEIKKVLCGRSIGYCIKGKFMSQNTLRKQLVKVEKVVCPF